MDLTSTSSFITKRVIKIIKDYNELFETFGPAVRKYFYDHYDKPTYRFSSWDFCYDGEKIEISCIKYMNSDMYEDEYIDVPTETIVDIAIDLILNKKEE